MNRTVFGTESHRVRGERLLGKVRELIHEGNVRRIIIKNEEGRTLIEAPLTIGVAGAVVAPVWAAIGAIAALVADCSIEVERDGLRDATHSHGGDDNEQPSGETENEAATREQYRAVDEQC